MQNIKAAFDNIPLAIRILNQEEHYEHKIQGSIII